MAMWNAGRTVKSSALTLQILEKLVEIEGGRVSEISSDLDVSKSTACNHLHTLQKEGYVVAYGDEYHPSLKLAYFGEHAVQRERPYELAREVTNELDDATPFETTFIVEENGLGRYLVPEANKSRQYDEFAFIGQGEYLHTIAAGKMILASYSEKGVKEIIDHRGLPAITDRTITTEEELFSELEEIRELGYAVNRQENREEVFALAKTVKRPRGSVLGAMSVISPSFRITGGDFDNEVYRVLFDHVKKLENRIETTADPISQS